MFRPSCRKSYLFYFGNVRACPAGFKIIFNRLTKIDPKVSNLKVIHGEEFFFEKGWVPPLQMGNLL